VSQDRRESGPPGPPEAIDSEVLFRSYAQFVASFLHRLGVRAADIEDAVQEVFLAAHRKGGYRPGTASPTTFLARLALDARRATVRRNLRFWKAHREPAAATEETTPEYALSLRQTAERLQAALEELEPELRAIFLLFELEGESCQAIAEAFDLKLGTVYSRLHHARSKFEAYVARAERHGLKLPGPLEHHGQGPHALTRKC
jgi:RNA polymerase sigma-70 factor (ECF subfamily)